MSHNILLIETESRWRSAIHSLNNAVEFESASPDELTIKHLCEFPIVALEYHPTILQSFVRFHSESNRLPRPSSLILLGAPFGNRGTTTNELGFRELGFTHFLFELDQVVELSQIVKKAKLTSEADSDLKSGFLKRINF